LRVGWSAIVMLRMDLIEDEFNGDVRFVVFEFVVLDKVMRDVC
jgi:hypothetical protein